MVLGHKDAALLTFCFLVSTMLVVWAGQSVLVSADYSLSTLFDHWLHMCSFQHDSKKFSAISFFESSVYPHESNVTFVGLITLLSITYQLLIYLKLEISNGMWASHIVREHTVPQKSLIATNVYLCTLSLIKKTWLPFQPSRDQQV